ncbi:MAG: thiamine pyrophosphate-dependent dehydrogenase E1 component subunit alpha [Candidatus Krumholzibacteriota bacterium]|nr:thiamine pyrophosphate-dependent dehydrogenase E1 component subunit alpha [Candidatus Krumholzibacteriota bacterium]
MEKLSTYNEYSIELPATLRLDSLEMLELYYYLVLNRGLEHRLGMLYRQGKVVGGLYSSLGQEACSVGSAYALEDGDFLAPMIRNLGALMVRGVQPIDVMAQYCARATSPTRGKDLNVHFGWVDRGLIAPISMVGALIPVMAGVALEMKMRGKKSVALTYIGDGGMSTTDFHEGVNFAAVQKLPFILIVENNLYAYSTPVRMQANVKDLIVRAKGYGMYGEIVDGNNIFAMVDSVRRARERCVAGGGPVMIEAKTFRRKGHAEHDDAGYVPEELRKKWERKDPIEAYERFLVGASVATEDELADIKRKANELLEKSAEEALNAPFPDASIAQEDVYA